MFPFDPPKNIRKPLVDQKGNQGDQKGNQGDQKGKLGRKGLITLHFSDTSTF